MRKHMGQQSRSGLKPRNFIQVRVRSNGGEMKNLVESALKPRRLGIEEDEAHASSSATTGSTESSWPPDSPGIAVRAPRRRPRLRYPRRHFLEPQPGARQE